MLSGVGQVVIFGEQKYAPTIQLNPSALAARGLGPADVASAISGNTVEQPVGALQGAEQAYQIGANSQLLQVDQLGKVIVAYRNGAPVRVSDIGRVVDGTDVPLQLDWVNNHIGEMIGMLAPAGIEHPRARRSYQGDAAAIACRHPAFGQAFRRQRPFAVDPRQLHRRETDPVVHVVLVIIVIFLFLRSFWATVIPSVTVPLSLVGTFAVLYLGGYSLDNLSLMALTLAVGLVVDDAIVMLENIFRYLEQGDDR